MSDPDMDCSPTQTENGQPCCCKPKPTEGQRHSIGCRVRYGDLRPTNAERGRRQ